MAGEDTYAMRQSCTHTNTHKHTTQVQTPATGRNHHNEGPRRVQPCLDGQASSVCRPKTAIGSVSCRQVRGERTATRRAGANERRRQERRKHEKHIEIEGEGGASQHNRPCGRTNTTQESNVRKRTKTTRDTSWNQPA